jgi:hypothetical protein
MDLFESNYIFQLSTEMVYVIDGFPPPPLGCSIVAYSNSLFSLSNNSMRRTPPRLAPSLRGGPHPQDWEEEPSNGSGANWSREHRSLHGSKERESLGREYEGETRLPGRRSQSNAVEKNAGEPSIERAPAGRKRSGSEDPYADGNDSDLGDDGRHLKKAKLVVAKVGREESSLPKASKSTSSGESSDSSLDNSKELLESRDDVSSRHRAEVSRSKVRSPYGGSEEFHQHKGDTGSWRHEESKERLGAHGREHSQSRRAQDEHGYDRRGREDRERRDREEGSRRERGGERDDDARRLDRPDHGYYKAREEAYRKRDKEESGHWQRSDDIQVQKTRVEDRRRDDRSRYEGSNKDARSVRDRDRDRDRSRGKDDARPHQWEGSRLREDASRTEREDDRTRERSRRDGMRGRESLRVEEFRESDSRSHRHMYILIPVQLLTKME